MKNQILKVIKTTLIIGSLSAACQAMTTTADYEVPTDHADLAQASHFPIAKVSVQSGLKGDLSISYFLPQELTGLPNLIKLQGQISGKQSVLTSEYNKMSCFNGVDEITCQVEFNKLNISPTLANRLLSQKFSGEALQKRMMVQQRFSTDPVGIIHIKK